VPEETGCSQQRDNPPYESGTAEGKHLWNKNDSRTFWTPEANGCCLQRDDRCAGVAQCRGDFVRKSQTGNDVARRASREWTPGKRCRVNPEGSTEIKDPGIRRQLYVRIEKTAMQDPGNSEN
jgi:hypothetical protein